MDDIEAIRQLKARYFRTLDTKDWTGFRALFNDDVIIDVTEDGGGVISGADALIAFLQAVLADGPTVHHGHTPEIELTSDARATGVWAMEDRVRFPDGSELHGFGHYHDAYEKVDGAWRIASSRLTRLRVDMTPAPPA